MQEHATRYSNHVTIMEHFFFCCDFGGKKTRASAIFISTFMSILFSTIKFSLPWSLRPRYYGEKLSQVDIEGSPA